MAAGKEVEKVKGVVVGSKNITTYKASEYVEMHEKNGTPYGREKGQKTKLTTEELRILINAGWDSTAIKNKHGIDDEELKQVIWKLSKEELRDIPLKIGK